MCSDCEMMDISVDMENDAMYNKPKHVLFHRAQPNA